MKRRNGDTHSHDIAPSDEVKLTVAVEGSSVSLDSGVPGENHVPVNRFKNIWGCLLVVAAVLFLYSFLPLGKAFSFSNDEGFEVIKPFLYNKGFILYKEIWDDQPPIFTILIATAFKFFGTSILSARLVTAGFGLILFAVFHDLIRRRSGQWCALLAAFFLLASPGVILLTAAVMQEIPAMAAGLLAAWLLFQWAKQRHWAWLLSSGAVMAVALQIKFTAILLVPAILFECLLLSGVKPAPTPRFNHWIKGILLWSATATAILVLIGVTWGKGSLDMSWKSHTGEQFVAGMDRATDHYFTPDLPLKHIECVLAGAAGIALAFWRKRAREIAFPMALLLTDSLVHSLHRPWWTYYYLHLAIPLAWLAGWAVNEVVQDILRLHAKNQSYFFSLGAWKQWGLCVLIGLAVARSERRLEGIVMDLRQRPGAETNPIVLKMKEYAGRARLAYSETALYPFYAQLPAPPKLAVITGKRFWSGQITTAEIMEICRQEKIDLVVLPKTHLTQEWNCFLKAEYVSVGSDDTSELFASKQIEHP